MKYEELEQKLITLRAEWKTAGPGLRKLIQVRANLLKKRYEEEQREIKQDYDAYEEAKKIFQKDG